jgi:hypothetical protein
LSKTQSPPLQLVQRAIVELEEGTSLRYRRYLPTLEHAITKDRLTGGRQDWYRKQVDRLGGLADGIPRAAKTLADGVFKSGLYSVRNRLRLQTRLERFGQRLSERLVVRRMACRVVLRGYEFSAATKGRQWGLETAEAVEGVVSRATSAFEDAAESAEANRWGHGRAAITEAAQYYAGLLCMLVGQLPLRTPQQGELAGLVRSRLTRSRSLLARFNQSSRLAQDLDAAGLIALANGDHVRSVNETAISRLVARSVRASLSASTSHSKSTPKP